MRRRAAHQAHHRVAVAVGLASTMLTVFLILYPLFHLDIVRFPTFVPKPFLVGIAVALLLWRFFDMRALLQRPRIEVS